MKPVIIFGTGVVSEVVSYYLMEECDVDVAGYTVDQEFLVDDVFQGREVVPFTQINEQYPPEEFQMFVALGYQQLNDVRTDRLAKSIELGYDIFSLVHPNASVPKGTAIGKNCFIMRDVKIQPKVSIGDNVFIWGGALVGHHSNIFDNCWITSNACVCGSVVLGKNCFVGASVTIGNGLSVGDRSFFGAGALITKDVEEASVIIAESSEKIRLTSEQFLKLTKFT